LQIHYLIKPSDGVISGDEWKQKNNKCLIYTICILECAYNLLICYRKSLCNSNNDKIIQKTFIFGTYYLYIIMYFICLLSQEIILILLFGWITKCSGKMQKVDLFFDFKIIK